MTDRDALLHTALEELSTPGCGAVSLPYCTQAEMAPLLQEALRLPYRPARPLVGEGAKAVRQDFELSEAVPSDGAIANFAASLAARLLSLNRRLFEPEFVLNDRIVQRYPAGSQGITPHRDHLRYRNLVVLLTLKGDARLFLCRDRSGSAPQEVDIAPGHLVLMRAPGFSGQTERPFHYLAEVESDRISIGLRHDSRAADLLEKPREQD